MGQGIYPDVLIPYVEKVIHGKLSACQAAKLCLSPTAQAHHFIEKARRILDSEKLQALNRRLEANKRLITPEKEKQVVTDFLNGASQHQIVQEYHMWDQSVRSILHKHGVEIRDTSQQLLLRFHGRIPTVKSGLSKEKL